MGCGMIFAIKIVETGEVSHMFCSCGLTRLIAELDQSRPLLCVQLFSTMRGTRILFLALQDDDRDLAAGLLLIIGKPWQTL